MGNTTGTAQFDLTLDDEPKSFQPNVENVLVSLTDLNDGSHSLTLTVETSITADLGPGESYGSFVVFESAHLILSSSSRSVSLSLSLEFLENQPVRTVFKINYLFFSTQALCFKTPQIPK
jgi:hypothetical protein